MADEHSGTDPAGAQERARDRKPEMETFGPVTSLEPDSPTPAEGGEPQPGMVLPLGANHPAARASAPGDTRSGGVPADAGRRRLAHLLERIRGKARKEKPSKATPRGDRPAKDDVDWSFGSGREAAPETARPQASAPGLAADLEDAESAFLLDDAFLRKEFKEVAFPTSKELVLRYVDMEQDFAFGHDRTVNLHNLISHLEQNEFRTRKELLDAIRGRLMQHH